VALEEAGGTDLVRSAEVSECVIIGWSRYCVEKTDFS